MDTYLGAQIPEKWVKDNLRQMDSGDADWINQNIFWYDKKIARSIFMNKHVVFIGDSLIRAMYKDLLSLLRHGNLTEPRDLKFPNETHFEGDHQIDILPLEMNRVFRQAREFQSNHHLIQFFFTSRAMRKEHEKILLLMVEKNEIPDIIIMNSAIWDISRYHVESEQNTRTLENETKTIDEYLQRLTMFLRRVRTILKPGSKFIWILFPVVTESQKERGFINSNWLSYYHIRIRLMEANMRAAKIVKEAGFDVLDLSFHFRSSAFENFRALDGVHWDNVATRFMNQLLIGHLIMTQKIKTEMLAKISDLIKDRLAPHNRCEYFDRSLKFLEKMRTSRENEGEDEKEEDSVEVFRSQVLQEIDEFNSQHPLSGLIETLRLLMIFKRYCRKLRKDQDVIQYSMKDAPQKAREFFNNFGEMWRELSEELKNLRSFWSSQPYSTRKIILRRLGRKRQLQRDSSIPELEYVEESQEDVDIVDEDEEINEDEPNCEVLVENEPEIRDPEQHLVKNSLYLMECRRISGENHPQFLKMARLKMVTKIGMQSRMIQY
ncbi:unnamed protein product [Caenorhabditis angaria]|uniref:SGNH domain-containing protein n=1 Tax=Caenorhabditis angaria TaxID=860376 RepID=A0A9P1MWG5_9PELO|nr:unnamed protein product [Caenorhabditis angaria]